MSEQKLQARVYSRTAPTEEQLAQLRDFLRVYRELGKDAK